MRKFMSLGLVALMLGLLSTSCLDQIVPVIDPAVEETVQQPEGFFTVTATIASNSTKTALADDGQNVVWKEGDNIKVYSFSNPSGLVYTLQSGAGQKTATFTSNQSLGTGPFLAVYPASAVSGTLPTIRMTAPAVQTYAAGSFGPGANISYAISSDDSGHFSFCNVGGLLKLTIKGDESKYINRINLYSRGTTDADVLHGSVSITVNPLNPTNPTFGYPSFSEANGTVSLDCSANGGVRLGSSGVDFYFFLPEYTLANGFQVEIIDSDGKAMLKSAPASSDNAIALSTIRPMPEFVYAPQYNSAFLTSVSEAGVWTGVLKDQSLAVVKQYTALEAGNGQYAVRNTSDGHTLRFQNWSACYAVTLTTGASLTLNSDTQVTVSSLGNTTVAPKTGLAVKVVKQYGGRSWLVDETDGNGYIIR